MAAVVVAGRHPVYELTAADLVVRQLDELSFVNLKQLFRNEELAALTVSCGQFSPPTLLLTKSLPIPLCLTPQAQPCEPEQLGLQ